MKAYFCHIINKKEGWDYHAYLNRYSIKDYRDMGCKITITDPDDKVEYLKELKSDLQRALENTL